MLSKEVVAEIFVAGPHKSQEGHILPAPISAVAIRNAFKDEWLDKSLKDSKRHMVSIRRTTKDGVEGFSVRKEIIHKPSP